MDSIIQYLTQLSPEAIIGIIVSSILALITIYQSYRSNKLNRKIALQSPDLLLGVYKPIKNVSQNPDYIILSCKIPEKKFLLLPLKLNLTNAGEKSAEDIKIIIRCHKGICGGFLPKDIFQFDAPGYARIKHEIIDDGNFQLNTFFIDSLDPHVTYQLNLPLSIAESTFFDIKDLETKDGFIIPVMHVSVAHIIDYVIFYKDAKPVSGQIQIQVIDTSNQSLKDKLDSINKINVQDFKKKLGKPLWLKRILYYYKQKHRGEKTFKKLYLVSYDDDKVKDHSPHDLLEVTSLWRREGFEDEAGEILIPFVTWLLEPEKEINEEQSIKK